MKNSFNKIIFYSRPWEVNFHIELAGMLRSLFPGATIVFASFFIRVVEECRCKDIECLYLPEMLTSADGSYDEGIVNMIDEEINNAFGTGLNVILNGERFLPETNKGISAFEMRHIRVLSALIEERTLSISSMYDHFVYCLAGALAINRSGAHIAYVGCGVPGGRVLPLRAPSTAWSGGGVAITRDEYDRMREEIASKKSSQRIEYMKILDSSSANKVSQVTVFNRLASFLKRRRNDHYDYLHGSYFGKKKNILLLEFFSRSVREFNKTPVPQYDISDLKEIRKKQGIFVALHMEPEATLLMYSPWMNDQIQFIRLLALSLPADKCIYVKENPKMIGIRKPEYYTELKKIPNVYLVDHAIESNELIANTLLTASIAGTVTVEAYLMGKPSLCAGKPPFYFMATYRLYEKNIQDLKFFLEAVFNNEIRVDVSSDSHRELFEKWSEMSFEAQSVPVLGLDGDLHVPSSKDNVSRYIASIKAILNSNNILE